MSSLEYINFWECENKIIYVVPFDFPHGSNIIFFSIIYQKIIIIYPIDVFFGQNNLEYNNIWNYKYII